MTDRTRSFYERLKAQYGYRTIALSALSFSCSVLFGLYNGVLGIVGRSIWFGALAAYYILLAFLRGGVLFYHARKSGEEKAREKREIALYRNGGLLAFALHVALSSAIAQMIFENESFTYLGWTIYGFAAYAFYKITMAIYNLVKSRKQTDLTVRAVRNYNLMDASVSILALQTALLSTFSTGNENISLMNTFTGIAVAAVTLSLGIEMLLTASKEKKKWRKKYE